MNSGNKVRSLDRLGIGKDAIIEAIECDDKALRSHILDMGLTPGVEVTLVKTAPMGDPLEIRVRGYELTLRKSDASKIIISDIHDAHNCPRKNSEFNITLEHSQKGEEKTYETRKLNKGSVKTKLKLALAGNQNCGKTTLFNQLTGSNQHVGNFPGVTVDRTDGTIIGYKDVTITDLPGIYSLSPYSSEEIVTRDFILREKPDGLINIVDASNIERNLLLTTQLIELDVPMVIALNMMDEVTQSGGTIDINGLESALGVPVVPISTLKNQGIDELVEHVINVAKFSEHPGRLDFCEEGDGKEGAVHRCIHALVHIVEDHAKDADIPVRFAASKLAAGDSLILKELNLDNDEISTCKSIVEQMEKESGLDHESAIADMRFTFIEKLCDEFVFKPQETTAYRLSAKVDKFLTGKYTAILSFLLIMSLIFYLTFGPFGTFLSNIMEFVILHITRFVDGVLTSYGLNPVVHSLIIDGIFSGVGSVLGFLPVIVKD